VIATQTKSVDPPISADKRVLDYSCRKEKFWDDEPPDPSQGMSWASKLTSFGQVSDKGEDVVANLCHEEMAQFYEQHFGKMSVTKITPFLKDRINVYRQKHQNIKNQ
jgi:hypothetical protein